MPQNHKVKFTGNKDINSRIVEGRTIDPSTGITLDDAITFWTWVAEHQNDSFFTEYRSKNGHDWVDEDLKALLVFLTRKRNLTGSASLTGYRKLVPLKDYHTVQSDSPFEADIVEQLRKGNIVIIDLSQGDPVIQQTFAEKICLSVFRNAMDNFVNNRPNNFIQFYFEEAHNLFPKKDDKDLSIIASLILFLVLKAM